MLQTTVVEKIKTLILCSVTVCPKISPFMRYVQKYGKAGENTHPISYWITKATNAYSEYCFSMATMVT
jgi:hypothetical protein